MERRPLQLVTAAIVAVITIGFAAGCALDDNSPPGDRPASVPAEYVPTPSGWFHPSCLIEVAHGERLQSDGSIARSDGRIRTPPACAYARYDRMGAEVTAAGVNGDLGSHAKPSQAPAGVVPQGCPVGSFCWAAYGENNTVGAVAFLHATWFVPSPPTLQTSQVLYYFPGLSPLSGTIILQPVLAWGQPEAPGWSIASWNCCPGNNVHHGPFASVNPGDELRGDVFGSNCSGGVCGHWQIFTGTVWGGAQSIFETDSQGSILNWAFGGVLEAYQVASCNQYPASGSVSFRNISVWKYDNTWVPMNPGPSWSASYNGAVLQCGATVTSPDTGTVTITVNPNL